YGYGELGQGAAIGSASTASVAGGAAVRERAEVKGQAGSGGRPEPMLERDAWRFEEGFTDTLQRAGVRVIDRSTIIRLAGSGKGAPTDVQRVEMAALKDHADLLVEVL